MYPRPLQVVTSTAIQSFQPGGVTGYTDRPLDIDVPVKHTAGWRQNYPPGKCLTFRLFNRVSVTHFMGFLPANFQLPTSFRSPLRQTTAIDALCLLPIGAGHKIAFTFHCWIEEWTVEESKIKFTPPQSVLKHDYSIKTGQNAACTTRSAVCYFAHFCQRTQPLSWRHANRTRRAVHAAVDRLIIHRCDTETDSDDAHL